MTLLNRPSPPTDFTPARLLVGIALRICAFVMLFGATADVALAQGPSLQFLRLHKLDNVVVPIVHPVADGGLPIAGVVQGSDGSLVELPPGDVPESVLLGSNLPNLVWLASSGKARFAGCRSGRRSWNAFSARRSPGGDRSRRQIRRWRRAGP